MQKEIKMKIKKSVSSRFKVTKTGKVLFAHQNQGHLQRKKSARAKRRHKEIGVLQGRFAKKIKRMLGK